MSPIIALWTGLSLAFGGPVTGLSITPVEERTQILISVEGDVEYRDFTMEGPSRLVVDVFGARHALPRANFLDIRRGGVTSVRTSQYSADIVRVVLELEELVDYQVVPESGRIRISLAGNRGMFEPWTTTGAPADVGPGASTDRSVPASTGAARNGNGPREALGSPPGAVAEQVQQVQARRIDITFSSTPIAEVLHTFAEFSGRSIVAGSNVEGTVTATIDDQPWDEALQTILQAHGFVGEELPSGIIRVSTVEDLNTLEEIEPVQTRAYKVNYATAQEMAQALEGITTVRGAVTAGAGTNTVIVTDVARVHEQVARLIGELDVRTPQVTIQAKIIFVNRTDLNEFGITYDLKDSAGNQLNVVTPGATDADGDGVIELPEEQVEIGTNVVALGGNSVAALGNATNRVPNPTLTLLSSLLVGRHTLITFVEALESVNLSDIQAAPHVTVSDNNTARIQVGEETPLRVLDAAGGGGGGTGGGAGGGGGQAGGGLPLAAVEIKETGIILEATPHIIANNNILLDLHAERSAPQLAESDVGFIFTTQNADTRVLVEDGQTVVIAGLTVTERNEVRSGIPLLMDLPVLGPLFRVTRESEIQRDLIILVTPHIVREPGL